MRPRPRAWRATCAAPPSSSSSTATRAARPRRTTSPAPGSGALSGDPVSAFGGVVAVRGAVDADARGAARGLFLEVVVPRASTPTRSRSWRASRPAAAGGPGDRGAAARRRRAAQRRRRRPGHRRGCAPDDPRRGRSSRAAPAERPRSGPTSTWPGGSAATSVERHRAGQGRRRGGRRCGPDEPRRQRPARRRQGRADGRGERSAPRTRSSRSRTRSRSARRPASRRSSHPGGSKRDAEVIAAADAAGAAMLLTGVRHFRH